MKQLYLLPWLTSSHAAMFLLFPFLISLLLQSPDFAFAQADCQPESCRSSGPEVRFPFRLNGRHPPNCGYPNPAFVLSCDSRNETILQFQFPLSASTQKMIIPLSATASVTAIHYRDRVIELSVTNGSCLPNRVPLVNSSASPFQFLYGDSGFTLFNCSSQPDSGTSSNGPVPCLSHAGFQVYAIGSYYSLSDVSSLSSCVKMYNISYVPPVILGGIVLYPSNDNNILRWSVPDCSRCESKGRYCRLKTNTTSNETECFDKPKDPQQEHKDRVKKLVISGVVVGVFLMTLVLGALCTVYRKKKRKRDNERKLVQFLDDYRALRPTRYSYSDIKRMTDGFKHKLGRGGYGTVFKGMLSNEIPVAIKILNNIKGNGEEFINEVGTIGNIHHVNVVRLVGYCADGYRRALVYEYLENDSLEKYITSGNRRSKLGWEKLFEIALGIAKGIEYLHQGCNQQILHFDIKPQNILLDQNLHPKVADFGLAKLCSKEKSVITMTAARGTIGYIAPEVFSRNFGRVSYKSDIYSFGMVLLDLVGGRKNFLSNEQDDSQVYFPEWMYDQLEKGENIDFQIDFETDINLVKRMIIVALWCIQWYPIDRPSMKLAIQMLEGEDMPIMPPNPFAATDGTDANDDSFDYILRSSSKESMGGK